MVSYLPPLQFVPIFDSLNYTYQDRSITYAQLAKYLPLIGGTITGNLYVNGILSIQPSQFVIGSTTVTSTATQLNYVNVTPGIASGTSALILDSGRNVININNLGVNTVSIGSAVLNATDLGYISGTTPGTASASQAIILDSSSNITAINNLTLTGLLTTPNVSITGTTDSTSKTTGCLVLAGGMGIAKSLFVGTGITVPNASGGNLLTLASTATNARSTLYFQTDTQNWEFGARGSTAANPNSMYIYNGAYKLIMNNTGDTQIFSTTDATTTTTGALQISGGISCQKQMYATRFNSVNNGSNYSITNGSNTGLIEVSASPNMLRLVSGPSQYTLTIGASGANIENSGGRNPRYQLDMGATANDVIINLFQGGVGTNIYGIGANNSALELHSGQDFTFYYATTANGSLGTKVFTANLAGNCIATGGLHSTGFSTAGLAALGNSAHMHFGSGTASFIGYNYNTSTYLPLTLGPLMQVGTNGGININTATTSTNFPLSVYGSGSATRSSGGYGFLNSGGSGSVGSASFTRNFAIYCDSAGILVAAGEIDVFSDLRLKDNIIELDDELCDKFINNINPIQFNYKKNDKRIHYGFAAQELIKNGFDVLVGVVECEDADCTLEEQNIKCINGETFHVPSDIHLSVSVLDIVPILHKALKISLKKIKLASEEAVKTAARIKDNENEIADLQEQINTIISHLNGDA